MWMNSLTQELEQAKQEQIKLARRIAKLERQAVALDAEQTSRETSGRNIEIIVGVIAVIKGKTDIKLLIRRFYYGLGEESYMSHVM